MPEIEVTAADRRFADIIHMEDNPDHRAMMVAKRRIATEQATEQASDNLAADYARNWCIKNGIDWGPLFDDFLLSEHRRK